MSSWPNATYYRSTSVYISRARQSRKRRTFVDVTRQVDPKESNVLRNFVYVPRPEIFGRFFPTSIIYRSGHVDVPVYRVSSVPTNNGRIVGPSRPFSDQQPCEIRCGPTTYERRSLPIYLANRFYWVIQGFVSNPCARPKTI